MSSHSIKLHKAIQQLKAIRSVQRTTGNWNFSPYMHGLFNGIEIACAFMENREPKFKDAPVEYLDRSKGNETELTLLREKLKERDDLLSYFQQKTAYASPWWIKIERVLNPDNPDLKNHEEDRDVTKTITAETSSNQVT